MTDPNISPDGYWRWNGAQWVPNLDARAQTTTPGRRDGIVGGVVGGVVGAAVLAPVIFPDTNVGGGMDFGSFL